MPIIHPLCAVLSLGGAGPPRGAPDRIDPFPADLQDGLGTAMALVALGSAFEVVFDAGAGGGRPPPPPPTEPPKIFIVRP